MDKAWQLYSRSLALVCVLMLRGPQTLGELRNHSRRLFEFDDLEDVKLVLNHLVKSGFAVALPRQAGQKEGRYAHLLCGEPEMPPTSARSPQPAAPLPYEEANDALLQRIEALEARLAAIEEKLG